MADNVLKHEPHQALFVPNERPLLFYEAIIFFSKKHLKTNGAIYVELHEQHANAVEQLFRKEGFTFVQLKKDLQGKERMVKAKQLTVCQATNKYQVK
jgi:release factor glutamine methyltransferase